MVFKKAINLSVCLSVGLCLLSNGRESVSLPRARVPAYPRARVRVRVWSLECVKKSCACARSLFSKTNVFWKGLLVFLCLPVFVCPSIYQDDVLFEFPPVAFLACLEAFRMRKRMKRGEKGRHVMNEDDSKKENERDLTTTRTRRTRKQADRRPPASLPLGDGEAGKEGSKEGKGSNVCNISTANTHTPNKEKSKHENSEGKRKKRRARRRSSLCAIRDRKHTGEEED